MKNAGILVYGYKRSEAKLIQSKIERFLNKKIRLVSGNGLEDEIILNIISKKSSKFVERKRKYLMFFNLPTEQIDVIIDTKIVKHKYSPIIVRLNKTNKKWSLSNLLKQLNTEVNNLKEADKENKNMDNIQIKSNFSRKYAKKYKEPNTIGFMFILFFILFITFIIVMVILASTGMSTFEVLAYSRWIIEILFFLFLLFLICDIYLKTKANFHRINEMDQELEQMKNENYIIHEKKE